MPDSISWSFNAAASSGGTSKGSGRTAVDAVFSARVSVAASTTDAPLALQLDNTGRIKFLALTSSNDVVTVKGGGTTPPVASLKGPLVLHGGAVALFSSNLGQIFVTNSSTEEAEISILIGYDLD